LTKTFEELGVGPSALKAITELGFENPTPVQEKVIPELLKGATDMVALAQTGTGKTAAFGLPLMSLVNFMEREPQALILAPTRELCMQIASDLKKFSKYIQGANIVAVYGGASIRNQVEEIDRGAQIIVATPGRMVDIIERKKVDLGGIEYVILDEADEMLNMGFKEDLDYILSAAHGERNTWLFSATMPDEVNRISKDYMNNPIEFTLGTKNLTNENIEHIYYVIRDRERYNVMKRIADYYPDIFALIFCRTKIETQKVSDMLIKDGYNADALHGDLSQAQRDHVMKRFRNRTLQFLVATDVAARGLDVSDITHVIHYHLPDELEGYTHRSGRTARAGKTGISISIVTSKEIYKIKSLEKLTHKKFIRTEIPSGNAICKKQLFSLIQNVHNARVNEEDIKDYLPKIYDELKDLDKEEIIKRFVSIEFNRFLDFYKNAPDLNAGVDDTNERYVSDLPPGIVKLFVSVGRMDNLDENGLKSFLITQSGIPEDSITGINLQNSFSFIEMKTESQDALLNGMKGATFKDRPVRIEASGARKEHSGDREWKKDKPYKRRSEDGGGGFRGKSDRGFSKHREGFSRDRGFSKDRGGFSKDRGFSRRDSSEKRGSGHFDRKPYGEKSYSENKDSGFSKKPAPARNESGRHESSDGGAGHFERKPYGEKAYGNDKGRGFKKSKGYADRKPYGEKKYGADKARSFPKRDSFEKKPHEGSGGDSGHFDRKPAGDVNFTKTKKRKRVFLKD
jgi:ATP-dependent RNA helicase DeaD